MSDISPKSQKILDILRKVAAETLEQKRRLGHYAIVWQDGKPVAIGEDAPDHLRVPPTDSKEKNSSNSEGDLVVSKDLFHEAVKRGLQRQQWYISSDPLEIEWDEVKVKIDLAAERLIAAERGEEKIAVEIKSFISPSPISDFHTALGQFLNYRIMLEVSEPDRQLYLAVPLETYETFFQSRFAQVAVERHSLKLIVYNPILEEIVAWIS